MTALTFTKPLTLTALVRSPDTGQAVKAALAGERHLTCEIRPRPLAAPWPALPAADVVLIEADPALPADMAALEDLLATMRPGPQEGRQEGRQGLGGLPPVIVLTHETEAETSLAGVRHLMRLGIADVVLLPLRPGDLPTAIAAAHRAPGPNRAGGRNDMAQAERRSGGAVIAVLKSCGGSGATTVAVHVAAALARRAGSSGGKAGAGLIDLDLQFGSAALYLDLTPRLSVLDLIGTPDRLDAELLSSAATRHASGMAVLPAPPEVAPLDALSPAVAATLIASARRAWGHTVLDLPHAWTAWSHAVLSACDAVLLVTQLTVPGIHHTRRQIETLRDEGLGGVPVVIAVNRHDKTLFRDPVLVEAEKALGRPLEHLVPSDFKAVSQAIDAGTPLQDTRQGRRTVKRLHELADAVARAAAQSRLAASGG